MKKNIALSIFTLTAFILMISLTSAYSYTHNALHSPAYDYPTFKETTFTTTTVERPSFHGPALVTVKDRTLTQEHGRDFQGSFTKTNKRTSENAYFDRSYWYNDGPLKIKETTVVTRRNYGGSHIYGLNPVYRPRATQFNTFGQGPVRYIDAFHWNGYA